MNLKQIIDKIPREADVQPNEYPVEARLEDVNQWIAQYIALATQIGSKEPMSIKTSRNEVIPIVDGSQTVNRTIIDIPIFKIEYRVSNASKWQRIEEDLSRSEDTWCGCDMTFFATEKQITIENGKTGEIRITYAQEEFSPFQLIDYTNEVDIEWIPFQFLDLLWIEPALTQALFYKKDRVEGLKFRRDELKALFINHYKRNAKYKATIKKDRNNNR